METIIDSRAMDKKKTPENAQVDTCIIIPDYVHSPF